MSKVITILVEGHRRGFLTKKDIKWTLNSAEKGKNMHGFYQGFKLHIIINKDREIVAVSTTKANVHNIQSLEDSKSIKHVKRRLVGDKGYITSHFHINFTICPKKMNYHLPTLRSIAQLIASTILSILALRLNSA